ncbi:MAG: PLP-dependent transferase [Deltaproteobacteria bacterium]|nr:PLP-dependent transferase [Deltaproteobacteria bacterium]
MNERRDGGGSGFNGYSMDSFLVHGLPDDAFWEYGHHVIPPLTASTTFRLDSVERGHQGFLDFTRPDASERPGEHPIYIYDRVAEPTVALLEHSMMIAERGSSATAFGSGMAAISAALGVSVQTGGHVVSHRMIYGCTFSLLKNWLPRHGIDVTFADLRSLAELAAAIRPETRVVYFETPANPTLELIDVAAVAKLVAERNEARDEAERIRVIVDNTFATPLCQRPLEHGADVVVQSLTKNVMGFGTDMGGMLVARDTALHADVRLYRKDYGGVLSPRGAWAILVYGLPSLRVRTRSQVENCFAIARFLEARPEVCRVSYPGLPSHPEHELAVRQMTDFQGRPCYGSMLYFELAGDPESQARRTRRFIDHLAAHAYTITLAVSLGQLKTLVEAPGLMTHSSYDACEAAAAGMSPGGVRLALGIEDPGDLMRDLEAAFSALEP